MTAAAPGTQRRLFFDTMCLSHFARAERLDVLRDLTLDQDCWTTTVVRSELAAGAVHYPELAQTLSLDWLQIARLDAQDDLRCFATWAERLGAQTRDQGEASIFAAAERHSGIAITDDREATRVARRYGAEVHGTIWLLAAACRGGKFTVVNAGTVVDALRRKGARLPCTGDEFGRYAAGHGLLAGP
ncbi:hypothetical protein [Luedemannella helvata]|uniref:PIN domain-containing protein n=1 Tax=Luedemannella helvata TaxID=349315 RepID=A0ABP4WLX4_9ACTN